MPTLATSTDPVALVPGSVQAVYRDADDLERRGSQLSDIADLIGHQRVPSWCGPNAARWAEHRGGLVEYLGTLHDLFGVVARTLRAHADVVARAQRQAQVAVDLWRTGLAAEAIAGRLCTVPQPSLGTRRVPVIGSVADFQLEGASGVEAKERAERILLCAQREARQAATAAAAVLDEVSEGLPDGRWHMDGFFAGVGEWVVGTVVLLARLSNARAVIDPHGYNDDYAELVDGLTGTGQYLVENPLDAPAVLFDTGTMHDDPGRWWGNLAPDVVLTIVTAGGGGAHASAGTRVGLRGATVAARLMDGVVAFPTGAGATVRALARAESASGVRAIVDAGKFEYLFGSVSSGAHNTARSAQNAAQLARIGVYDNAVGRGLLGGHFDGVVRSSENVLSRFTTEWGAFEVRDSLFAGPGGFVRLESTWHVTGGGLRLVTVIPFGGM